MHASTIRRVRAATVARWIAALTRADTNGVQVRQVPSGVWIATSGTDEDAAYVVTPGMCECIAAAHGDPVCQHRAALRRKLGLLPFSGGPSPAAPSHRIIVIRRGETADPATGEIVAVA